MYDGINHAQTQKFEVGVDSQVQTDNKDCMVTLSSGFEYEKQG